MINWFKLQENRDFDRAHNYLQSSRIVMNSAIETLRTIEESDVQNIVELLELYTMVRLNARFLNDHMASARQQFGNWRAEMNKVKPERYDRVRHMLQVTEKNFEEASEKTDLINLWLENGMALLAPFC